MSCLHQHQQKTSRPRFGAQDGGASVSPIHFLLDLCTFCKPPLLLSHPLTARKKLVMFLWSRFLHSTGFCFLPTAQSILPFKTSHSRFPLPFWSQSTTMPCTVTGVFLFCQDILRSALAHLRGSCLLLSIPIGIHGCSHQSLIPAMPNCSMQPPRREVSSSSTSGEHCSLPLWSFWLLQQQGTCSVNGTDHTVPSLPGSWVWRRFPSSMQLRAAWRVPPVRELTGRNLGAECWSINKDEPK